MAAPREAVEAVRKAIQEHWQFARDGALRDGAVKVLCGNDACAGWMTPAEFATHVAVAAADAAIDALGLTEERVPGGYWWDKSPEQSRLVGPWTETQHG